MRYNLSVIVFSSLLDPSQPQAWLLGSAAAAIAAANLAWLAGRRGRLWGTNGGQIGLWAAAALFYIIPPFFAWRAGALSPRYLGVSGIDWVPTLLAGAPVVGLVIALFIFAWLAYRRTLTEPLPTARGAVAALRAALEAALRQWHWAFYRAAAIAWIATWPAATLLPSSALRVDLAAEPLYWGSWVGMGIAALESLLNPFVRRGLRGAPTQAGALRQVILAIATTALFTLTRNFWLGLIAHAAVEVILVGWLAHPSSGREAPHTAEIH